MGTYRKTITIDCDKCHKMKINEQSQMICKWGNTEKILLPQKGKKPLQCKLIQEIDNALRKARKKATVRQVS